ncbi:MAG TPA: GNAT family N-acetyltransferase [Ilumatobacter sp.]
MIDPHVRVAVGSDAPQLRALESLARTTLETQRGGLRWLATHPEVADGWVARLASTPVFVAHIDGVLVGYLAASQDGEVLRIDDVFVQPEAREVGFGDELLAAAMSTGRQLGCRLLEGEALPGDRDTKNLYERAGIKARLITVSIEL